jgi:hypothetical protein
MNNAETPSEFYRIQRPEYFSDSEEVKKTILTKEVLAYELNQISTNQKQDDFETLCRKLAEELIAPNLIPQVGPTGGGDGKTDFETYPVSKDISERWFVPEKGWDKDEKWAFAISAKKDWRPKVKEDIKKIIGTNRGYTRVYFITNQSPSSKKKKDAQDEFKEEFKVDVVILDSEWILEKVYDNNLIDLVVNSLNLSTSNQNIQKIIGSNDASRIKELEDLENNISNIDRYSEYDFQLVEDALESAILSRMLEKPRDEVEGKFDRALRFCKKINNQKQWLRIYYQRSWTCLYYYDDYSSFIENFKELKKYISRDSSISEIEKYFNLLNSLYSLHNKNFLSNYDVDFELEKSEFITILTSIECSTQRPNTSLVAKMYKVIIKLTECIEHNHNPSNIFKELLAIISQGDIFLDFPFESSMEMIHIFGNSFPNNSEYDDLIDDLAKVSEQRNSQLTSGEIFFKRGRQKLLAKNYQESIVYFGKAVIKLAKEETQNGMRLVLLGMGMSYKELGLIWASNSCYISACSLSVKSISDSGIIGKNTYQDIERIIENELLIGRIPSFFAWYEMYCVLTQASNIKKGKDNKNDIDFITLIDECLSVRLLHTNDSDIEYLPSLLEKLNLYFSQDVCFYKLGYDKLLIPKKLKNEQTLDDFYTSVAGQPFVKQMLYQTNFMTGDRIFLTSKILGCKFIIKLEENSEILLEAEMLLAFFESFFATLINELMPHLENVTMNLCKNSKKEFTFAYNNTSEEYNISIDPLVDMGSMYDSIFGLVVNIFTRTFILRNDTEDFLNKIFKKEEVQEKLSLIVKHKNTVLNLLGNTPKLFFGDWLTIGFPKKYDSRRKTPLLYDRLFNENNRQLKYDHTNKNFKNIRHDEIKVSSIIDINLWNKAKWKGFGFCLLPVPQEAVGIIIAYENFESGQKIFEKWINKFGLVDKNNNIRVAIIKGVDKNNPYWYRVHICKNIETIQTNSYISSVSRVHEMNPQSAQNLEQIIEAFNLMKKYKLYPAKITKDGDIEEPLFSHGILKTTLTIKNAWEIGEHDIDRAVIKKNDAPVIPNNIKNAPILKILKESK